MRHKTGWFMASVIIIGMGLIFSQGITKSGADEKLPAADPAELWKYITETSPYTVMSDDDWHFLPGWEGRKEGQAPHGAGIITYVNDIGYKAAMQKETTLPEHTIVVKENYAPAVKGNKQSALWPNAKLAVVTVMYKVKGFNPEANDWYWVKYLPDGSVDEMKGMKLAGKPKGCIQCHASGGGKKNDYMIGYNLSEGQPQ